MQKRSHFGVLFIILVLLGATTYAQEVAPADSPVAGLDAFSLQAVISYVIVWVFEKIKQAKAIPFFNEGATYANTILAWIFAIAQSIGIGWQFDSAAGTLMLTGLTLPAIVEVARAYIVQKGLYYWFHRPVA